MLTNTKLASAANLADEIGKVREEIRVREEYLSSIIPLLRKKMAGENVTVQHGREWVASEIVQKVRRIEVDTLWSYLLACPLQVLLDYSRLLGLGDYSDQSTHANLNLPGAVLRRLVSVNMAATEKLTGETKLDSMSEITYRSSIRTKPIEKKEERG